MIRMVADAELIPNVCRDALGGPDLPDEAERFGTLGEQARKLCALLGAQPGRGARWRLAIQGFGASLARPPQPSTDRALADAQGLGDSFTRPASLMECPRP